MQIGELNVPGRKKRKRVGRGPGSGHGKTSTRGHKGQHSRSGFKSRAWFEGGQMPLQRRVPKRGFNPLNKVEYQLVNISALQAKFEDGASVDALAMREKGLIKSPFRPVKILGDGGLSIKLAVSATKFSKSAAEKINAAGGSIQTVAARESAAAGESAKKAAKAAAKPDTGAAGAKEDSESGESGVTNG